LIVATVDTSFRPDDADLGHREEAAMPANPLPANPSLEQLRKKAKELRDQVRTGHPKFTEVVRALHPRLPAAGAEPDWARFRLSDAQLIMARMYGFANWRGLREHLDVVARYSRSPQRGPRTGGDVVDEFLRLACLTHRPRWRVRPGEDYDDADRQACARRMLAEHPFLAAANIHTAAVVGDVTAARALLAGDAPLGNAEGGPHGWPPLLYLTSSRLNSGDPVEVARLLLAHGADPNAGYLPDGEPPPVTALGAVLHGRLDPVNQPAHRDAAQLARLLLDAGADPNDERAVDNAGGYPHDDAALALLLAAGLGHNTAPGPWRQRLGDLRVQRRDGRSVLATPARLVQNELRYAAEMNLIDRVRLLLRHATAAKIDMDATDDGPAPRRTAHDIAVIAGNTQIADLLAAAGATAHPLDPADQLVAACMRADRVSVDRLLAADPGLADRVDVAWLRPLHHAAFLNRPDAIVVGASVGFPLDDVGGGPLHVAALVGNLEVVKTLIRLGADSSAAAIDADTPGQFAPVDPTPLGWARYNHQHEVVEFLLAYR
jgi:ankyrin repeat protein